MGWTGGFLGGFPGEVTTRRINGRKPGGLGRLYRAGRPMEIETRSFQMRKIDNFFADHRVTGWAGPAGLRRIYGTEIKGPPDQWPQTRRILRAKAGAHPDASRSFQILRSGRPDASRRFGPDVACTRLARVTVNGDSESESMLERAPTRPECAHLGGRTATLTTASTRVGTLTTVSTRVGTLTTASTRVGTLISTPRAAQLY
jgi:hypothetical protein